mmetsp:Transcript_59463/g.134611  ORF Transcript_59463/g.134611 Transcript_59463/m.134611 type:complete len:134 (+) Transcript_59463:91-492(+)|eukprot:CAMPEP_0172616772 /NCGR_PEP_ID=MMETSP1068-20121228/67374_1 /TAXON_ID=35684 /ORGANISM="Pseudopedinella elastica, Strain CCMP716" /LENGTH=133 /DNA_ID=CAMNT_0013422311 /DNA_START=89 /DNA_END=490 /DNA_ORIENTATION=+
MKSFIMFALIGLLPFPCSSLLNPTIPTGATRKILLSGSQPRLGSGSPKVLFSTNQDEIFESFDDDTPKEVAEKVSSEATVGVTVQDEADDDPFKKIRVLFYIGISLVPILFLLPFLSSSDFQPLDPAILESMQ